MLKKLFGSKFELILYEIEDSVRVDLEEKVYSLGLELQEIFNFYSKTSELSKLNDSHELRVSDEFLGLLKKSIEVSKLTNGEFDVSLGENIKLRKSKQEIKELNYSYKDISIDGNNVALPKDMKLDFGSCAKGYIVDLMIDFLKKNGVKEGFVDADGDMAAFGNREYVIGIAHPRKNDESLCNINLKNSAVATSGDYNQYDGDFLHSHIINQKDVASVTVIAPTLSEADIYSTALFVLDKSEREELIEKKNIQALVVDRDKL